MHVLRHQAGLVFFRPENIAVRPVNNVGLSIFNDVSSDRTSIGCELLYLHACPRYMQVTNAWTVHEQRLMDAASG